MTLDVNFKELTPAQLSRLINMLMGELEACRSVISTLIASHPHPDLLQSIWNQSKAEWVDEMDGRNVMRHPDYQTAFIQTLSAFSRTIDESELVTRPDI
jgi:hypothetical protein